MSAEKLRKYIIRQLAGDFRLSEDQTSIRMEIKTLTPTLRNDILSEGRLWALSDDMIDYTIRQVLDTIADSYMPRTRTLNYLKPGNIKAGLEIRLIGSDGGLGIAELELLSMGRGRFLVLKCDRKGLVPGEVVRIADDRTWGVDHCAFFKVERQTSDAGQGKVYRTFTLTEIQQTEPSEIIEIADSADNFTFNGERIESLAGSLKIPLARNPMSLLLDNVPDCGIIDLCFDGNGKVTFKSDRNVQYPPSPIRNELFEFHSTQTKGQTVYLETITPGRFQLDAKGSLLLECKAEANVIES